MHKQWKAGMKALKLKEVIVPKLLETTVVLLQEHNLEMASIGY